MINSHRLGLVLGAFAALLHIVWVLFVGLGWAGSILFFVYRVHFLDISFAIADFSFGTAVTLVVFAAIWGYVVGNIFGFIWNFLSKETNEDYVVDKGY